MCHMTPHLLTSWQHVVFANPRVEVVAMTFKECFGAVLWILILDLGWHGLRYASTRNPCFWPCSEDLRLHSLGHKYQVLHEIGNFQCPMSALKMHYLARKS